VLSETYLLYYRWHLEPGLFAYGPTHARFRGYIALFDDSEVRIEFVLSICPGSCGFPLRKHLGKL